MNIEESDLLIKDFIGEAIYELPDHETIGFSESWDALMSVVERIKDLNQTVHMLFDECFYRCQILCYDKDTNLVKDIDIWNNGSPLKDTYIAVVEFIKWYNKNK